MSLEAYIKSFAPPAKPVRRARTRTLTKVTLELPRDVELQVMTIARHANLSLERLLVDLIQDGLGSPAYVKLLPPTLRYPGEAG